MSEETEEQDGTPKSKTKSLRDELRAATVGSSVVNNSVLVDWNGKKFEVRAPSLQQQKFLRKVSTEAKSGDQDIMKALVFGIIETVYVPGTDIKVFEAPDVPNLMARGTKDFIGTFTKALGKLAEIDPEEIEKNSSSDPTESY